MFNVRANKQSVLVCYDRKKSPFQSVKRRIFVFFQDRLLLCRCPEAHSVDEPGLNLVEIHLSLSQSATMPS